MKLLLETKLYLVYLDHLNQITIKKLQKQTMDLEHKGDKGEIAK